MALIGSRVGRGARRGASLIGAGRGSASGGGAAARVLAGIAREGSRRSVSVGGVGLVVGWTDVGPVREGPIGVGESLLVGGRKAGGSGFGDSGLFEMAGDSLGLSGAAMGLILCMDGGSA